ncbi:MAG: hypothetical protein M3Z00_04785 [Actinomycetota bacterium]|nr:hypothetical protein [Actinomycetota bacterium]
MTDRLTPTRWDASARWNPPTPYGATARQPEWSDVDPAALASPATSREPGLVGLLLTGYLDAEIRLRLPESPTADRFRWSFGPGIDRAGQLRSTPAAVRAVITELPSSPIGRFSLGWIDGERRHHLAPGRASLSSHIARRRPSDPIQPLTQSAAALGSALKQLTEIDPTCADQLPPPAGPPRLGNWLKTGEGPWGAAVMHDTLTPLLGQSRIDEIVGWIDEMPQKSLVHGRAGFGATVVPESAATPAVLIGDEIAYGPRDFDLSWALGDLLVGEHMTTLAHPAAAAEQLEVITACRDAFLVAYGPAVDMIATGRTTIIRVLLELHDSAAYLDRQLTELAAHAPELVDSAR